MNRRRRSKFLNRVMAGVTAILVLLFLLDYSDTGITPNLGQSGKHPQYPSYFLVNTTSSQYDKNGTLDFTVYSEHVKHDPSNDSAKLKAPHLQLFRDGLREWIVDAHLGVVSSDGETIDLQQRVVVSSEDQETIMETPQLLLFPDKKLAKTDKPVTLRNPNGFTRSIGLVADMNSKRLDLQQQVRGQYRGILFEDEQ